MKFIKEKFKKIEDGKEIVKGAGFLLAAGWLCFRSPLWCAAGLVLLPFYLKYRKKEKQRKRQAVLQREFKDVMAILYSSTAAGGTLEKAFRDAADDMKASGGKYPVLLPEFERICFRLSRNIPMEDVLEDFAKRSGDEDISQFVRILSIAKKSGGSLSEIIRHTVDTMILRMEINDEIDTLLAGKKGELKVMMIVPPGILLYMNLCSAEYMTILYETLTGRCVMLAAVIVYSIAVLIGEKILDIQI